MARRPHLLTAAQTRAPGSQKHSKNRSIVHSILYKIIRLLPCEQYDPSAGAGEHLTVVTYCTYLAAIRENDPFRGLFLSVCETNLSSTN